MKELLKYEFRKTWAAKLMVLGITAVAQIAFLIGLAIGDSRELGTQMIAVSAVLLSLIAIFGILFIGIQSVMVLHRDMNTKQGYMLFMTPRSSYQILGAKFLENGFSLVLAGAAFFLLGTLDVTMLFSRFGELDELWNMAKEFLRMINSEIEINLQGILVLAISMMASWLATVAIAYLADIVSSALLNGKKHNGILTFLLFILMSMVLSWLKHLCTGIRTDIATLNLIMAGVALVYAAGMYFLSAWVMDRYLSV